MSRTTQRDAVDRRLLGLAIALGRRNNGLTWPNPSVGAVLVRTDGETPVIVAQGVTEPGGRPHAEPVALAAAGDAARGATLYVSLEPCSHHGRTPPCTDAIIAAGVARVVFATYDPDPRVAGTGEARLLAAGLDVRGGLLAEAAERAHCGHITRVTHGRPAIRLKLARTLDGIAGDRAQRLLITGQNANVRTHAMRARADAILVGIGTVMADDPRLDVRLPGLTGRRPVRVTVDGRLRIPSGAHVVRTADTQPTWVVCTDAAPCDAETRLREAGVDVIRVAPDRDGRVDLRAASGELARRGLTRLLCEGGPALADALAAEDLVDEIVLITSQARVLPNGGAVAAVGPALRRRVEQFTPVSVETVGPDRIELFERKAECSPVS